jgi:hypothetical protein
MMFLAQQRMKIMVCGTFETLYERKLQKIITAAAEQTQTQHQPRKRGKARTYIDWKQFDNLPAYHEFWGREKKNWTKNTDNNTGTTYLNCKYSRKTGFKIKMKT